MNISCLKAGFIHAQPLLVDRDKTATILGLVFRLFYFLKGRTILLIIVMTRQTMATIDKLITLPVLGLAEEETEEYADEDELDFGDGDDEDDDFGDEETEDEEAA